MNAQEPEITNEEIAELAYAYWQERADGPGCAEDDWCRAEQDLRALRQAPLQPEAD